MPPSEAAIEEAITRIKAASGTFQRLVEGFAALVYPALFEHVSPVGRRSDDVTVRGWPDAVAFLPEGIAVCEATTSEKWQDHLDGDIDNVAKHGSVAAFLFAAWHKTPSAADLLPFRKRLLSLGVPAEKALLIFREQLIHELARPRCARLWAEPLNLPVSALPFERVEKATQLFGSEHQADTFAPLPVEYLQHKVHLPALAVPTEQRLQEVGWALIRGRGASGKTVLAAGIALRSGSVPAYYLDLTDFKAEDETDAIDVLATWGDERVLFIVDTVHLEPRTARRLFEAWSEQANGSRLLLLGRFVTPHPDHRGRSHPLEALDHQALHLAVQQADLAGVYRRILGRRLGTAVPEPPSAALASWERLFGGDLLAFSAAVTRQARQLQAGTWDLQPEDAQSYIQKELLEGLSGPGLQVLSRMALLATLEISASAKIGQALPATLVGSGLVLRTKDRTERHNLFRFVHPGLLRRVRFAESGRDLRRFSQGAFPAQWPGSPRGIRPASAARESDFISQACASELA
jgi:hypothetical protein